MGSVVYRVLYPCFGPHDQLPETLQGAAAGGSTAPPHHCNKETGELMFCFTGLMGAYLVWGLLQEKIMTQVCTYIVLYNLVFILKLGIPHHLI